MSNNLRLRNNNRKFLRRFNNFFSKNNQGKKNIRNDLVQPESKISVLKGFFKSFLTTSTIHGLLYLSDNKKHPIEILIWLSFVIAGMYGSFSISIATWTRYQENPTVISMERDWYNWNTSFPAATLCPTLKIDEPRLEKYLETSTAKNKTLLREFILSLAQASYTTFDKVIPYDEIPSDQYLNILEDLLYVFKPSVSNTDANGYKLIMQRTVTEMGICYSFNSRVAIYSSPNYWNAGLWKILPGNLHLEVHPLDGEVSANMINMSTAFQLFIHGPYEVAEASSKSIYCANGFFLQIYFTALTIFSSQRARDLNIGQRKCRFYDESNLAHSPVYSYRLCKMECRIYWAKKYCGCVPYFYRKLHSDKICNVEGMHCLAQYSDKIVKLKKMCNCLPNCDEVNYVTKDMDATAWILGSNLQWGIKEYPKMRIKRDVLFGFTDLLVYIGGMAGLFLGCSVLSFVEIVYFFTIRLFWFTVNYIKH